MHILCHIALSAALLVVAFTLAVYARRAAVLRRLEACDAVDRLGIIDAVWAFFKECAALAAVMLLLPAGWLLPACRRGGGARGPLILVHGWSLNRGCWWWMRRRLVRDGWSPVCCFDYRSLDANVEAAARGLHAMVQHVTALSPAGQPLTLIGHSLGGLVLRYYARRYPAPNVRRLVTLGTPHFGTELAVVPRIVRVARKVAPGSPFLNALNAGDRVPKQFDVIALYSTFDAFVVPPRNARYPDAFNIEITGVGHNALLFSSKVYRLLVENLATPMS